MKIEKRFHSFTFKEYFYYIDNRKKYTNFNELALYRSILENEKLTLEEQIEVRDYAHQFFGKFFEFLQVKDPYTYVDLISLGEDLTEQQRDQLLEEANRYAEKTLKEKRIKHRNFGVFSRGARYSGDQWRGFMSRQSECQMPFASDRSRWGASSKSEQRRTERKRQRQLIEEEVDFYYENSSM